MDRALGDIRDKLNKEIPPPTPPLLTTSYRQWFAAITKSQILTPYDKPHPLIMYTSFVLSLKKDTKKKIYWGGGGGDDKHIFH